MRCKLVGRVFCNLAYLHFFLEPKDPDFVAFNHHSPAGFSECNRLTLEINRAFPSIASWVMALIPRV